MKKILFVVLISLLLTGCGRIPEENRDIFCMDTIMSIKVYGRNGGTAADDAEEELKRLEKLFDRGDVGSDVYAVNNGGAEICADTESVIQAALEVSRETDGAFDITVAPIMDLWGFYGGNYQIPEEASLKAALGSVDYKNVFVKNGMVSVMNNAKIDLGGIGKGYASDKVCEILTEHGITSAMINLGGNVYAFGEKPNGGKWRVGVADPDNGGESLLTLDVSDAAVVTSGNYQRYFESGGVRYHHIIDPHTGKPADNGVRSVTVVCNSGVRADALSTALFVMGKDKAVGFLESNPEIGAVIITEDGKAWYTESLSDCITINHGTANEVINVSKY